MSHVRSWIEFVCESCGVPELKQTEFEFSNHMSKTMGIAFGNGKIKLSTKLFKRATETEKRNTVIHEMCHIVAWNKYGPHIKHHGKEWQGLMIACGLVPNIYHNVDTKGLGNKVKRYVYKCSCRNGCRVSTKRHRQIQLKTAAYSCARCNVRLNSVEKMFYKLP